MVHGILDGPVICKDPVDWGSVSLLPASSDGGGPEFLIRLLVESEQEADRAVALIPAALQAFVAVGWRTWTDVAITGCELSRPRGPTTVTTSMRTDWRIVADLSQPPKPDPDTADATLRAVLRSWDERLVELLAIFTLGLRQCELALGPGFGVRTDKRSWRPS